MHLSLIATINDVTGKNKKVFEEYAEKLLKVNGLEYINELNRTNKVFDEAEELLVRLSLSKRICKSIYDLF